MAVRNIYESQRDLLIGQLYKRGTTAVASRAYTYDTLGRPVMRRTAKNGATVNDSFGYNSRRERSEWDHGPQILHHVDYKYVEKPCNKEMPGTPQILPKGWGIELRYHNM